MTRTTPLRLMTLHFLQIRFTDALTFIVYLPITFRCRQPIEQAAAAFKTLSSERTYI